MLQNSDLDSFYYFLDEKAIQCNLCARHCKFTEDIQGYCGVIKRTGNQLENLVEGRFTILKKHGKELCVGGLGSVSRLTFDPFWIFRNFPIYLQIK
jgi:hypothetical protein